MLTGIIAGLVIGLFHILKENYRIGHLKEDLGDGQYAIRFTEHMTFLNKAAVMNALRALPEGSHVTIDGTASRFIDADVKEVVQSFATHAALDKISLDIKGIDGISLPEKLEEA